VVNVLFVCLGNICRSPSAEGVFRSLVAEAGLSDRISTDSAGMGSWHIGRPPDQRAQAEAKNRGISLSDLRARRVRRSDFMNFDYVLAMDRSNHADLAAMCPRGQEHRLAMFLDFAGDEGTREVPDPYYGGPSAFARMFDLIQTGSHGLLAHIRQVHF